MEAKNWEDTVIGKIIVIPISGDKVDITPHLETQAKIAFKAGEDKGKQEGKQEGIKLVVDWVNKRELFGNIYNEEDGVAWQAFLKEVKK